MPADCNNPRTTSASDSSLVSSTSTSSSWSGAACSVGMDSGLLSMLSSMMTKVGCLIRSVSVYDAPNISRHAARGVAGRYFSCPWHSACARILARGCLENRVRCGFRASPLARAAQPSWAWSHLIVLPRQRRQAQSGGAPAKKGTDEHGEPGAIQRKRKIQPAALHRGRARRTSQDPPPSDGGEPGHVDHLAVAQPERGGGSGDVRRHQALRPLHVSRQGTRLRTALQASPPPPAE